MFSHSKHTQTLTRSCNRTQQNRMKSHHRLHLHNLTHSHHTRIVTGTQSLLTCSDTLVPAHRITLSHTCVYMNSHNTRCAFPLTRTHTRSYIQSHTMGLTHTYHTAAHHHTLVHPHTFTSLRLKPTFTCAHPMAAGMIDVGLCAWLLTQAMGI